MSIAMSNLIWQYFHAKCDRKMLALKLADNADEYGRNIFPSVETCARYCGASTRSIQRWLAELVDGGLIQVVKYANGGRGKAREYRINPDFINAHDPRVPHDQRPKWEFNCGDKQSHTLVSDDEIKGDTESPFVEPKRVTEKPQKGDTAQSVKGDSAVSPQLPITVIERNTPLPPDGGDAEKFSIDKLLTSLIHIHGAHDTTDTKPVRRALAELRPGASMAARMLADLAAEVRTDKWQRDGGRWRPKLSRWLRGWHESVRAGVTPAPVVPSAADKTREQIEKSRVDTKPPPAEIREQLRQMSERFKAGGPRPGKAKRRG